MNVYLPIGQKLINLDYIKQNFIFSEATDNENSTTLYFLCCNQVTSLEIDISQAAWLAFLKMEANNE